MVKLYIIQSYTGEKTCVRKLQTFFHCEFVDLLFLPEILLESFFIDVHGYNIAMSCKATFICNM